MVGWVGSPSFTLRYFGVKKVISKPTHIAGWVGSQGTNVVLFMWIGITF